MLSLEVHDEDFGAVFVEVAVNDDLVVTNSGSLVEEVKRHMDLEPVFERTDLDRSNDLDGGEFEEFKKYDLGYSHGRLLPSSCIAACENCYRSHITNDRSDPYYFDMYRTWTKNIVGVRDFLLHHLKIYNGELIVIHRVAVNLLQYTIRETSV